AGVPTANHVADPRAWTVSERLLALVHYNVHSREDRPNYAVTDQSTISDYLELGREPTARTTFVEASDEWTLYPLTGAMAEAIEALQGSITYVKNGNSLTLSGLMHWLVGAMSAQLLRAIDIEKMPDAAADQDGYIKWLAKRMPIMAGMPGSTFDLLYAQYRVAMDKDRQFFRLWFDSEGVIVMPLEQPNGAQAVTPAARFLVRSCIGQLALAVAGKS
ncbi:hypothetical protein, partial [Paraburkholderia sp. C35]|uniref:hypothetical protein n=1 Tax=Paraburkholderia sp. C35 TaxID=2126993 RepID=UPI000D69BDEE